MPASKPTRPGQVGLTGGVLQMLAITDQPMYETAINQTIGAALPVSWVTIDLPDPVSPQPSTFNQGLAKGGARFRRLEGCWYAGGKIYFLSTNGGNMGFGQVFVFDPVASTLTLIVESPNHDVFDGPDNLCTTPGGGLIMCEDAGAAQFLRGVSPSGQVFEFARNLRNTIEFAGACFSPDGQTLFVNLYGRFERSHDNAVQGRAADSGRTGAVRACRDRGDLKPMGRGAAVKPVSSSQLRARSWPSRATGNRQWGAGTAHLQSSATSRGIRLALASCRSEAT